MGKPASCSAETTVLAGEAPRRSDHLLSSDCVFVRLSLSFDALMSVCQSSAFLEVK